MLKKLTKGSCLSFQDFEADERESCFWFHGMVERIHLTKENRVLVPGSQDLKILSFMFFSESLNLSRLQISYV